MMSDEIGYEEMIDHRNRVAGGYHRLEGREIELPHTLGEPLMDSNKVPCGSHLGPSKGYNHIECYSSLSLK